MPVLSSFIGICAFAETYRNRLAFDEVMLRNQMLGNSIADVVHFTISSRSSTSPAIMILVPESIDWISILT